MIQAYSSELRSTRTLLRKSPALIPCILIQPSAVERDAASGDTPAVSRITDDTGRQSCRFIIHTPAPLRCCRVVVGVGGGGGRDSPTQLILTFQ